MTATKTLLGTIETIAADAPEEGLTLGEIADRLNESAFGALLVVLAMPCCIPGLYIIPQIVALPMLAIAAQLALGRDEPWMPARLAARMIDKTGLTRTASGGRKWFGWTELFARPRLTFLSSRLAERWIGVILCVFCASILVPLPLTNTVPGIAVAIVAFGLLSRDGLLILGGLAIGTAWIAALVYAAITGIGFLAG
ncbi:MAG: exopolysaccharide biosynthesis protein [Pseudomonadota bacterium]